MKLLEELRMLRRVEQIFERYCREGKRPTRQEADEWLKSLGWQDAPRKTLLNRWYGETT